MRKQVLRKAKGDIWWQSAKTFGQISNRTAWRLARTNRCVSRPKFEIGSPKLDGWAGDRLREDAARNSTCSPPATRAQHFVHHLAPTGVAGFLLANGSRSSTQSGEGDICKANIEADLVDCMVVLPGKPFSST